jgi:hypothetical protein
MSLITFIMMLLAGASTEFLADAPSTVPYLWVAKFIADTAVYAAGLLMHPPTSLASLSQLLPGSKPAVPEAPVIEPEPALPMAKAK